MRKKKEALPWGGYLNMRLTEEQKRQFQLWYEQMKDDVWELFLQSLMEGMKFSLTYDSNTDTYTACLTNSPRCPCGVTSLYVLSAFAQDWRIATAILIFKHYQLLGGTWENFRPSRTVQDNFG